MLTGTTISTYFYCERKCWLNYNKINMENNSEDVHIGKILHEEKSKNKSNSEIQIENIKIDKITEKYIIEIKKSDSDLESAEKQLKYYMYILSKKGIIRDGKIEILENNKQPQKTIIFEYSDLLENEVKDFIRDIKFLLDNNCPPDTIKNKKCKKCSYYDYCYI